MKINLKTQFPFVILIIVTFSRASFSSIIDLTASYALANSRDFTLSCPLEQLITIRKNTLTSQKAASKLLDEVIKLVEFTKWLKNDKPIYRENGNSMSSTNHTRLVLYDVGLSDTGSYTCLPDYTNIGPEARKYLNLIEGARFNLHVDDDTPPDSKPIISHPPADHVVTKGSNVTFTCNHGPTASTQSTNWFKILISSFNSSLEAFFEAHKMARKTQVHTNLKPFFVKNNKDDYLHIRNVSEKDIGIYGCVVHNYRGIDLRLGSLDLFELHQNLTGSTLNGTSMRELVQYYLKRPSRNIERQSTNDNLVVLSSTANNVTQNYEAVKWALCIVISTLLSCSLVVFVALIGYKSWYNKNQSKRTHNNLALSTPLVGDSCKEEKLRQHLPNPKCPDIYSISHMSNGFISGHLHQGNAHLLSQSVANILDREKNPSISSTNSNSDEASSWGKSMSSQGDTSRAFYLHTSNTTSTTVPLYDPLPSRQYGATCVINPTYGFIRPQIDTSHWAFPRRDLERLNKIGEGQFGEVWKYKAKQKDGSELLVAVKQLKNRVGFGDRERLDLIAEIEIMKLVNDHPNVIKLLNYCADDREPLLLIMEYAEHGKLQEYLRSCRSSRKSHGYPSIESNLPNITSKELIKFSYHIAKGMEYVASQGIVHRDLASRNILVSKDRVCKVADFGFARRVNDECAYEMSTANPVPVKWMAPEALVENQFTSKSDVFSLGILMWEIVTLGATPYEYMTSSEVYKKVTSGSRLERPAHCKLEFYQLMSNCWHQNPAHRPTFKELARQLEKLLISENDYIELDQYPEHAYYNILNTAEKEVVNI